MQKILLTTVGIIILIILFLLMMMMLGYRFNKQFIIFDKNKCIEQEYATYYHHSGIEGCIFWMRHDYLEKEQLWKTIFKRDEVYCNSTYGIKDNSSLDNLLNGENTDPKCTYSAFQKQKRDENWNYLTSKEKDGFYNYCVEQVCPRQPLFK